MRLTGCFNMKTQSASSAVYYWFPQPVWAGVVCSSLLTPYGFLSSIVSTEPETDSSKYRRCTCDQVRARVCGNPPKAMPVFPNQQVQLRRNSVCGVLVRQTGLFTSVKSDSNQRSFNEVICIACVISTKTRSLTQATAMTTSKCIFSKKKTDTSVTLI